MSRTHFSANLATDDRESAMALAGINRYRERQTRLTDAGSASERDDYATIIRRSLLGVADRITDMIQKGGERRGRKSKVLVKVAAIDAVTVAYLTLSATFSTLSRENDKNKVATKIGKLVQDEFRSGAGGCTARTETSSRVASRRS